MAYNILFSQVPKVYNSQQIQRICNRFDAEIHFFPFTLSRIFSVEEFAKYNINLNDYPYILFTSVESVEYFFQMKKALSTSSDAILQTSTAIETKYICLSMAVALQIYQHIGGRKRKVFMPRDATRKNTKRLFARLRNAPILIPSSSEFPNQDLIEVLDECRCNFSIAPMYHIKFNPQLAEMPVNAYSVICFFTAVSVRAFMQYYPKHDFSSCYIGAYGGLSRAMLESFKLQEDFYAPTLECHSLMDALYTFLLKVLPEKA